MHEGPETDASATLLPVNVGNTRTSFCVAVGDEREHLHAMPNEPFDALVGAIVSHARGLPPDAPAVLATVNRPTSDRLLGALRQALGPHRAVLLNDDVPIPVRHTLDDSGALTVGQDRLLNALAAFEAIKQACVVIDAGTAVTVDFVDGEGVFHGGAIAPGARMMLRSLHEHAAALPAIDLARPDSIQSLEAGPFGRNTQQAMLNGVVFAVRGLARTLAERYAEFYEAYPQIIATGGDARLIFEGDDLIEAIVPDLTLRGIALAWRMAAQRDDEP